MPDSCDAQTLQIMLIHKLRKDPQQVTSYCPIILLSVLSQVSEKFLMPTLKTIRGSWKTYNWARVAKIISMTEELSHRKPMYISVFVTCVICNETVQFLGSSSVGFFIVFKKGYYNTRYSWFFLFTFIYELCLATRGNTALDIRLHVSGGGRCATRTGIVHLVQC